MDENKTAIGKIVLKNQAEKSWVKKFFLISEHNYFKKFP
jgi:hypothetical protein